MINSTYRMGPSLLLLALCLATPAHAQSLPEIGKLMWRSQDGFTAIAGVRELSDGRVLLSDSREKRIVVLSASGQTIAEIGRLGQGPGEFTLPASLMAIAADTTLVPDLMLRRYLIIAPDLSIVRTTAFPADAGWAPGGRIASAVEEIFGIAEMPTTQAPWVTLMRFSLREDAIQPIARLAMAVPVPIEARGRRIVVNPTFAANDGFAVAADGRIAVVRASDYRVEWLDRSGSRLVTGPSTSYEPVPLTPEERRGPFGTTIPGPASKPAFDSEGLYIDPTGVFWVRRSERLGAVLQRYDLFGPNAVRLRTIALPAHRALTGFGARHTYLVYTDGDGLQWLECYRR